VRVKQLDPRGEEGRSPWKLLGPIDAIPAV
jgi:hypothetical protein